MKRSGRRDAALAAWAAVAASAGDLALLAVANAARPELALPALPPWTLWLGGALGVVGIPLYATGYRAAAGLVADASPRAARVVLVGGVVAALLGGAIHGLTALQIHRDVAGAVPGRPPLEAVAAWGALLLVPWAVATVGVLAASIAFAGAVASGTAGVAPALALATPAFVTVAIVVLALPWELSRSFLAPAAPNLAHVVFFAACARAARCG